MYKNKISCYLKITTLRSANYMRKFTENTKCDVHCSLQNYFLSLFHCCSLQTFCLDGNFLTYLPEEMGNLQQLSCLGLSFNNFCELPAVCEKLVTLDKLALAGNLIETLDLTVLNRMGHIKSVDLR